jgi:AraC family transcriptional regulator, regulatory protein of adaptative response / methylated-DNA-[protein]-cysteine methyltransferase
MEIQYAVARCTAGRLLVAATGRGITAVYMGDSERKLKGELRREFPQAWIREDRKNLGPWGKAIGEYLSRRRMALDLPLDVRATAFQWRVWEELRRIPFGATRTYSEIARAISQPRAARAVARACATNPAALVIPCHRVVRGDGKLAGYRWGIERKRALLELERTAIQRDGAPAPRRERKSRNHHMAQPESAQARTIRPKRFAETR